MVGLPALRESVQFAKEHFKLTERKACRYLSAERSFVRYKKRPDKNVEVKARINHWVEKRPRYGQPRIHEMLLRDGLHINHKRTERLYYKDLRLSLRTKKKKRRFRSVVRSTIPRPTSPNEVWSMDFIFDQLSFGKRVKGLTMVDVFSKINHALEFDYGLNGFRVIQILENICDFEGAPKYITVDNGPQYTSHETVNFARSIGFDVRTTPAYSPKSNGMAEALVKTFKRDYVWFGDLKDAATVMGQLEKWFEDYNENAPHKGLKMKSPRQFRRENEKILAS